MVNILVHAALVRETLSMQARLVAQSLVAEDRWLNPLMWVRVWSEELKELIGVVAQVPRAPLSTTFGTLTRLAVCPDRSRDPLRNTVL